MPLKRLVAAIIVALMPLAAQAATVTYTNTVASPTEGQVVSVSQFDAALGTLTGAQLRLDGNVAAQFSFLSKECRKTIACQIFFFGDLFLRADALDIPGIFAAASTPVSQFCIADPGEACDLRFTAQANLSTVIDLFLTPSLTGSGLLDFQFLSEANAPAGKATIVKRWNYAVSITYTYEPPAAVPLPASLPLLAAGMGGLVLLARRRRV